MKSFTTTFSRIRLTSFSGLAPFISFLEKELDLFSLFDSTVTFKKKKRNFTKIQYFKTILILFIVGFEKLAHVALIFNDHFIACLIGVKSLPQPENIVRCFLNKFTFKHAYELSCIQHILLKKMHKNLFNNSSATIDCDSTPKDTCGHQEGTGKHYKNNNGYHPIMAFIYETKEFFMVFYDQEILIPETAAFVFCRNV
jgi:hypothetical protein